MRQNKGNDVERDENESITSSGSELDQDEISATVEEEEEKRYKTGKPKRVIIRARITHDQG
jgi:hypothetical protein